MTHGTLPLDNPAENSKQLKIIIFYLQVYECLFVVSVFQLMSDFDLHESQENDHVVDNICDRADHI